MLADLKRDLFPWQFANAMHAGLEPGPGPDTLVVDTGEAVERIELALSPSIAGLPRITKVLVQMHWDTKTQRGTLEKARKTPGLVEHVATRDMLTAYWGLTQHRCCEPQSSTGRLTKIGCYTVGPEDRRGEVRLGRF